MKVLVIGAGAWGTSLANLIANNLDKEVSLWSYEKGLPEEINKKNLNSIYLPGIKINKKVIATNKIPNFKVKYIFLVSPSQKAYSVIRKIYKNKEFIDKNYKLSFIICSKGIDLKKRKLLSTIVKEFFPESDISVLSGPTFAHELAKKLPTAATLACEKIKTGREISNILANNYFRIYLNRDLTGVQISATLKNILAIAAGITAGLGLGNNARAALISRGIVEIKKIVVGIGGKEKTVMGLAGIGDILLTCNSRSSRNFDYGYNLGRSSFKKNLKKKNIQLTEGIENIKVIKHIKKNLNIETPIIDAVYDILIKNKNIEDIVRSLIERPIKEE